MGSGLSGHETGYDDQAPSDRDDVIVHQDLKNLGALSIQARQSVFGGPAQKIIRNADVSFSSPKRLIHGIDPDADSSDDDIVWSECVQSKTKNLDGMSELRSNSR